MRINAIIAGLLAGAAEAMAQGNVCTDGPGAPLGIRGYTCASCSLLRIDGAAIHVFGTEPTVNDVTNESAFKIGDVITTVDGKPITTREGGQEFGTPRPGKHDIGLRRWDGTVLWNVMVHVTVGDDCRPKRPFALEMRRVAALARQTDQVSKIPPPPQPSEPSELGFAVSCTPSCSRITDKDGKVFWKHDGFPSIVAVRRDSPASGAGLKPGDLIAEVDGLAVNNEAGSRLLQTYSSMPLTTRACIKCEVPVISMVIIRDGERQTVKMVLDKPPT